MGDSGTFSYWINGTPGGVVDVVANGSGTFKYWSRGLPAGTVYPPAPPPPPPPPGVTEFPYPVVMRYRKRR
jgi:hypothetical protein